MESSAQPVSKLGLKSRLGFRKYFSLDLAKAYGLLYLAVALPASQIWHSNRGYFGFSSLEFLVTALLPVTFFFAVLSLPLVFGLEHAILKRVAAWLLVAGTFVTFLVPHQFAPIDQLVAADIERRQYSSFILLFVLPGLVLAYLSSLSTNWFQKLKRFNGVIVAFVTMFAFGFLAFSVFSAERVFAFTAGSKVAPVQLSSTENVFLVSFDEVQSTLIAERFKQDETLRGSFPGFVFFEDTIAPYPSTNYAMSAVELGRVPRQASESWDFARTDSKGLAFALDELGYEVSRGSPAPLESLESPNFDPEGPLEALRHGINKSFGLLFAPEWISVVTGRPHLPSLDGKRDLEEFYEAVHGFHLVSDSPTVHFYHLVGSHSPFSYDSTCEHLSLAQMKGRPGIEPMDSVVDCVVLLMSEMVDGLRELGIYDQASIFFFSDHGYWGGENRAIVGADDSFSGKKLHFLLETGGPMNFAPVGRYMPFLMAKPRFDDGQAMAPLDFSAYPASLIDIAPTVCAEAGCTKRWEGENLWHQQDELTEFSRAREFWLFYGALSDRGNWQSNLDTHWELRQFIGSAHDGFAGAMVNYSPLPIGEEVGIDFSGQGNSSFYALEGWSGQEENHRWSDGPRAAIGFSLDSRPEQAVDVLVQLTGSGFIPPGGSAQKIPVSVNGFPLGILEVQELDTFNIRIPGDLLSDNQVRLDFDIPNPARPCEVSDSGDCRLLGLAVTSMSVSYSDSEEGD